MRVLFYSIIVLLFAQQSYAFNMHRCKEDCIYTKKIMGNKNAGSDENVVNYCTSECEKRQKTGASTDFKKEAFDRWGKFLEKQDGGDNPKFHQRVKKRAECHKTCLEEGNKTYKQCDARCG